MTQEIVRELVDGVWVTRPKDQTGGGGSQPALCVRDALFTETAGAGTYTATFDVEAGTFVQGLFLIPLVTPWDADTAEIDGGDTQFGATGYYGAFDVNSLTSAWDSPALVGNAPTSAFASYPNNGTGSGYDSPDQSVFQDANNSNPGVRYENDDTITVTLTTTGAGGTSGRLLVRLIYFAPTTPTAAVKS